jgi:hypothetical protein
LPQESKSVPIALSGPAAAFIKISLPVKWLGAVRVSPVIPAK